MSTDTLPNAGNDLIRIHKVITRALNVSLQNCKESKLNEEFHQGFMKYVKALTILLHSHHLGEDEITFPYWRTRLNDGPFDLLIDQHQQMIAYLE
jgi:hypothetical protein